MRNWLSKTEPYSLLGLQNPNLVKIQRGPWYWRRTRVQPNAAGWQMDPAERAVCDDLSKLTAEEQQAYYLETCEDLGLDPATFPLRWIVVDGRLALAAETSLAQQQKTN